jgi:thiol-disulfide isomerase/thioredoxin
MMASISRRPALTLHCKFSLAAILAFAALLVAPAAAQQTATDLFAHAKAEAKSEHKNVLAVFSASWCGPCKLYERFLEDPQMKSITDEAFVLQRFDVGEHPGTGHTDTPGAVALRTALGASGEPGFPFIVITDNNGNPIVNSYRNGDTNANVGYPALPVEIDWYIEMLNRAAPALSTNDLAATRDWLRKHAPH